MAYDATFFAFVGLVLFGVLVVYLKVPGMIGKALDERSAKIAAELSEATRLREEAQKLLADYQKKRKDAEAEAAAILASAEREAEALAAEARQKTEDFIARRTAISEQKIAQAETDAVNAVRSAAVDLAIAAAEKVIASKADAKLTSSLFANAVSEVKSKLN